MDVAGSMSYDSKMVNPGFKLRYSDFRAQANSPCYTGSQCKDRTKWVGRTTKPKES